MAEEDNTPDSTDKAADLAGGITSPEQAREDVAADYPDGMGDAGKKALDAMKAERAADRKRAQDAERKLKVLEREREQERTKGLSEAERAIAEAETRGRTAAASEYGKRLARERFVAVAAKRNPTFDAKAGLDDLNTAGWLTEDGEPDDSAIAAAVDKWVPPSRTAVPSFDGGARTSSGAAPDMNTLLRTLAAR